MDIIITKGAREDIVRARRADGSEVATRFPKKGPIPHDAVHLAVERTLGLAGAFWGLIARGHHPEQIADLAKQSGHASAKRAGVPDPDFVEAIQAERAVEAFEADHWSGGHGDPDGIRAMADSGCEQSLVPALPMNDAAVAAIKSEIGRFAEQWKGLPEGASIEVNWPE